MAWDLMAVCDLTGRSSGDTSAYQYHLFVLSTTNADQGVVLSTGNQADGVWQNNSTAAEYGSLRIMGVSKVYAQAVDTAISVGTRLLADSSGHAAPSTAGTVNPKTVGISLGALSTGTTGIIPMIVIPGIGSTST